MRRDGKLGLILMLLKMLQFLMAMPYHWTHSESSCLFGTLTTNTLYLYDYVSLQACSAYRAWCPDRVLPQAYKYISESMGVKYSEGVILNLDGMFGESTTRIPMICFLSTGSDPTHSIDALAKKHDLGNNYNDIIIIMMTSFYCIRTCI